MSESEQVSVLWRLVILKLSSYGAERVNRLVRLKILIDHFI